MARADAPRYDAIAKFYVDATGDSLDDAPGRALLDAARATEARETQGVAYVHGDAADGGLLAGERFHTAVCHFGLSDIDNLDGALTTVARVLPAGGRFVFSVLHPCFPGWGADAPASWPPDGGYFAERWWRADNSGFRGRVGANHRTLSTYLNRLTAHGLTLGACVEPEPDMPGWSDRNPGAPPVPTYLVVQCVRAG